MSIFQKINCHGCGAPVEFKTTASLVAVCPYCSTVVGKSQEDIESYSKKSSVVSDFSKIQIGTVGRFKTMSFTVIGRLQMKYYYGFWNEWFIVFENGLTGWLSDVSNEYLITVESNEENKELLNTFWEYQYEDLDFKNSNSTSIPPTFGQLRVDKNYRIANKNFLCYDISVGEIVGAQGEFKFNLKDGVQFKAADLKSEKSFVTLDYSDNSESPIVYIGESLNESELFFSNTRSIEEINNSSGSYKGKLTSFKCPNCGNANPKVNGVSNTLFCISCDSKLDISSETTEILVKSDSLKSGNQKEEYAPTLKCGNKGVLNGKKYLVIGVILKQNSEYPEYKWAEYLLYSSGGSGKYSWLIEDLLDVKADWKFSEVVSEFPVEHDSILNVGISEYPGEVKALSYKNKVYVINAEESVYKAETLAVWGAFNWQINIGDKVNCVDYFARDDSGEILTKEEINTQTHKELTYSFATSIPNIEILLAFNVKKSNKGKEPILGNHSYSLSVSDFITSFFFVSLMAFFILGLLSFGAVLLGFSIALLFWFVSNKWVNKNNKFDMKKWFLRSVFTVFLISSATMSNNISNTENKNRSFSYGGNSGIGGYGGGFGGGFGSGHK